MSVAGGPDMLDRDARQSLYSRALTLWPGLDRARLARTHGDPRRMARLIARRTIQTEEAILLLLLR